jgi:hypothetical protein
MSVGGAIQAYRDLGRKRFTPKRRFSLPDPPRGLYSATALEEAIRTVIKEQCQEEVCADAPDKARGKAVHGSKLDMQNVCTLCSLQPLCLN